MPIVENGQIEVRELVRVLLLERQPIQIQASLDTEGQEELDLWLDFELAEGLNGLLLQSVLADLLAPGVVDAIPVVALIL